MGKTTRKVGRPVTAGTTGQKSTLGVRVTASLKDKLAAEAKRNDRSLSQEAELRLEQSFSEERRLEEVFGDRQTYAIMRIIGGVLDVLRKPGGERPDWVDDQLAHDAMVAAVLSVLEAFRPATAKDDPGGWGSVIAKSNAQMAIREGAERMPKALLAMLEDRPRGRFEAWAEEARLSADEAQERFRKSMAEARAKREVWRGPDNG